MSYLENDKRGYHGMYFVHVSGQATAWVKGGTHASVRFLGSRDFFWRYILPRSPPFKEPLIQASFFCHEVVFNEVLALFSHPLRGSSSYRIVSLQGGQFVRSVFMSREVVPLHDSHSTYTTFHKEESCSSCPWVGPLSLMFLEVVPCFMMLCEADLSFCCSTRKIYHVSCVSEAYPCP